MSNLKEDILNAVRCCPSAHNVQPIKLKFNDDIIEFYGDRSRLLAIADDHGKDFFMTLGVVIEGINIELSKTSKCLTQIEVDESIDLYSFTEDFFKVGQAKITDSSEGVDELSAFVESRFSFRGKFQKITEVPDISGLHIFREKSEKSLISKLFDNVNLFFLTKKGYIEELFSWMRFSKSHPKYYKDGLSGESLGISSFEVFFAKYVLTPSVFHFLKSIGIVKFLISEAPIVNSSSAVCVITCKNEDSHLEAGRVFYRKWLELTKLGFYGAPLSVLTDDKEAILEVRKMANMDESLKIVNIFRIGHLPKNYERYEQARLEAKEFEL